MEVSNNNLKTMIIFSFRYALGRQSMAPSIIKDIINEYKEILSEHDKLQIINDIDHAVEHNMAGMDCDVKTWKSVKNILNNTL